MIPKCRKCDEYAEPNYNYCKKHKEELIEKAINIFGREEFERYVRNGTFPIIQSGNSVGYAKSNCERCGKKFRLWRKKIIGFDKVNQKWIEICINCRKVINTI